MCPSNIVITQQPHGDTVAINSSVSLRADANGNPDPSVQWQISTDNGTTFTDIAGATHDTYSFTAPSTPVVDLYRAVFTNSTGSLDSKVAQITVDAPPAVTTNPASQTINTGSVVTFTVAATGTPTPSVQWQVSHDQGNHFSNIPLATTDSLTFTTRNGLDGDEFRAVFKNPVGTATTSAAVLTVDFAPSIDAQPKSQTVAPGTTVTLHAAADGNPAPTVQWQDSTDNGLTFTNISGATSDTYTFTAGSPLGSALYRAVFTNPLGTATTHNALITVGLPPTVTTNPVSQTVNAGTVVTFTAAATGTPTPNVQWQVSHDQGKHFNNVGFGTTDTLTFTTRAGQNGDEFRAVFKNSVGTATTSAAVLTVDFAPSIDVQPKSQTVTPGTTVTLNATADGNPAPTVQWQDSTDNGLTFTNITGATSDTYTFTAGSPLGSALYRAVFTNPLGTATTHNALITVATPPTVTTNPVSQTVNAGTVVTFTAAATGTPTPNVQWQVSHDQGKHFNNIGFGTTDTLTFTTRAGQNGDEFRAVFKNSVGTATTSAAVLTVDFAPSIDKQPKSQTVPPGTTVTLEATADGNPAPTVQWQDSTDNGLTYTNITGATADTYTFTASSTLGTTLYRAVFTNPLGTATTHNARITVGIPPTVTTNPLSQTVNAGTTVTFTAAATGTPTPKVQWQVSRDNGKDFDNIPFANSTTFTFTARPGQNGDEFRAVFTNAAGKAFTTAATLTVNFGPILPPPPNKQVVATGSQVTLTVPVQGNPLPTVQWQISTDNGKTFTDIAGATSATYTFTAPSTPGTEEFQAVLTNSLGSVTSPVFIVVIDAPPSVTSNPTSQTVNAGTVVTFTAAATGSPTPKVQWQVSTDNGKDFDNIPFANTTTLTFTAGARQNGDQFRAVFTNPAGKAVTTAATLTVDFAPTISTQLADQAAAVGSQVTLVAAAKANPVATAQWEVSSDGGKTFTDIAGATSNSYTFTAPSTPGSAVYRAVFTNSLGTATTRAATVTFDVPPTVTTNPGNQSVSAGTIVTFTAAGTGTPAPTVQWQVSHDQGKHWVNIAFATTDSLTFTARAGQTNDEFRAVFTNPVGQAFTSAALLTVVLPPKV
jgi:hypothetical protein